MHKITVTLFFLFAWLIAILFWSASIHTQSNDQIAVVGAQGGALQGTESATVMALEPGELLVIQGRSADNQFAYVQTEARVAGWIDVDALLLVNLFDLPVVELAEFEPMSTEGSPDGMEEEVTTARILSATATPAVDAQSTALVATATPAVPLQFDGSTITAVVTLTDSRLNLRSGPGLAYPVVAKAEPASRWMVIGQTKAGDWLQLQAEAGREFLWATSEYLRVDGNGALSVVTDLPAPPAEAAPSSRILVPTSVATDPVITTNQSGSSTTVETPATQVQTPGKTGLSGTLAFQDRIGGTIYLYDLNSDTLTPLTSGVDPAISPDARQVAFTRDGGAGGLYVINVDGTDERRIYNDHPLLRAPSWSPDGQWIVFSRANGYDDCKILRGSVCLPDSTILESLPDELQGEADVKNLVKDIPNQRSYHTSLARIAPDGNNYRDIPALDYAAAPDWGFGGIVYQSNAGIQRTADEADVRSTEVANDPLVGYFHDPDWQPRPDNSSGRVVFHRKRGSHWQIYAVNPDGSGLVALTQPVTALVDELPSNVSPTWSPDGQQIIYVSNRNSIESAGAWHFWVMNADGSDQRMLPIDIILDYTFSSEQMVSWAP